MKIFETTGLPNPARIRIALAEKNAIDQVQFVEIDAMASEHRSTEFLQKNPNGTVPVLELDDGTTISECTAITEYIDHTFAGPSLTGSSAKERAVIHMMQRRAETNLLDAVGAYFHHATAGLGPTIETYQNREWGEKQHDKACSGMQYFNGILKETTFITGEHFSMADITVYAGLAFADFAAIDIPKSYEHLIAWREAMAKRPSCQS